MRTLSVKLNENGWYLQLPDNTWIRVDTLDDARLIASTYGMSITL